MVNDTISDLLTRIRNGAHAGHKTVDAPFSNMSAGVLAILKAEGYIDSFEEGKDATGQFKQLKVFLRYDENGMPAISELRRSSKPGRRMYARKEKLPKIKSGLGVAVISTSQGLMTDRQARKLGIGGEIVATVY